jgi:hypothetical protein
MRIDGESKLAKVRCRIEAKRRQMIGSQSLASRPKGWPSTMCILIYAAAVLVIDWFYRGPPAAGVRWQWQAT